MDKEATGWDLSAGRGQEILKAAVTQDIQTYINRLQATVAQ